MDLKEKLEKCIIHYKAQKLAFNITNIIFSFILPFVAFWTLSLDLNIGIKLSLLGLVSYILYFLLHPFVGVKLWNFFEKKQILSNKDREKIEKVLASIQDKDNANIQYSLNDCFISINNNKTSLQYYLKEL